MRKIVLCADDYGLTRAINGAIRELVEHRKLSATSVMVVAPGCEATEVTALTKSAAGKAQIGLHVTLTAPYQPLASAKFDPLPLLMQRALLYRLDRSRLRAEIVAQIERFKALFGRPPDFVDGHQHVQLLPQIRDAFLAAVALHAPQAWVRQCGRAPTAPHKTRDRKALILDILSVRFRRKAAALTVRTNPAFAGTYDFSTNRDFPSLFEGFLAGLPDGGVVMCHPGQVDADLLALDPLTSQREREFEFFNSTAFDHLLATKGVTLA